MDELVKGLRFCAMTDLSEEEYPCDPCEYKAPEKYHIKNKVCYLGCSQQMMLQAADAIEELGKPRWIPVTERLPEHGWYLAYGPTIKMEVLHFHSVEEVWSSERYYNIEVTHWMPLPEPPMEEAT